MGHTEPAPEDPRVRPLFAFRLFRIPVAVQPPFLFIVLAGALSTRDLRLAALWAAIATAGIVWHELGHALAMRAFGYPPAIELVGFGGLTHYPEGARPTARQELLVSAAGPGAGLLLGAAVWLLAAYAPPLPPLAHRAVHMALFVNVGWSLLNLLPMLPLDGSHVCDHATAALTGRREPRWVGWASLLVGAGLALFALSAGDVWLGIIGGLGAVLGWRRAWAGAPSRRLGAARSPAAGARRRADVARARGDTRAVAAALLPAAEVGALPEAELAELVGALVRTGQEAELVELVRARLGTFHRREDARPLAQLALEALAAEGAHAEAAAVAQLAFHQLRDGQHAYDAAVHLVALGRPDEAVAWLGEAVGAGLRCGAIMLADPALAPLRGRPDFFELATRSGAHPGAA